MATHDWQDLDGTQHSLEHELRDALGLGRHRLGVEHDEAGFAVEFEDAAAPASRDRDSGDVDIMSDATFADPGSLSDQELRALIDRFAAASTSSPMSAGCCTVGWISCAPSSSAGSGGATALASRADAITRRLV